MNERVTMSGKPVFTVPAKTIINFDSGFSHKLLCDGPTFSSGTACNFSCSFCYVPAVMAKQKPMLEKHGVTGKHEDIVIRRQDAAAIARQQLTDAKGRPRFNDLNDRRVIYASPLVDVAGNMDLVRETAEICKLILSLTHWHIRLLSKSNLLPKVATLLDEWYAIVPHAFTAHGYGPKQRIIYGVSTGTLDDRLAKAFEHGTPLVSKRIQSLHWLQDNGYRTFGMVCPSLPMEDGWEYGVFAKQMADALRYDKCEHVWAEVINLRGESFTRTCQALEAVGYYGQSQMLAEVSNNKVKWEIYARDTFTAHAQHCQPEKLRFLQYVNNYNRAWWEQYKDKGAVLLS